MTNADFIHLRVHSAYSLSEGAIHTADLVKLCAANGMPAVAVTDTNNMFGALEFSLKALDAGVQPIIGCQLAITQERSESGGNGHAHADSDSLVLLAQNDGGYRNLMRLLSRAYLDGEDAGDPQVSLNDLAENGDGLIALTGGPEGPVGQLLLDGQVPAAEALFLRLKDIFPGRLYVEIMRHGMEIERRTESGFLKLAYDHDVPLVATNEVFFSGPGMYEAHDALLCIAGSAYVSAEERRRMTPQHGFKSAADMRVLFADLPEAIDNTVVVAKRCAFMVETVAPILPPFDCGEGRTEEDELQAQSRAGLEDRLKSHVWTADMDDAAREKAAEPYRKRLEYELGVINDMGFPGYFLIVADFIRWAKNHGIPVGPGRGSGAGSVVAWALTITDLDPLRFGLLFERFLNPERVSMPDFDIDFCQDRRDEVIRYVQEKYGRDHVAQIITFGKLQARAVLRDVGRVLEIPYGYVDKICKLVPNNPANPPTLDEAVESEAQLRQLIDEDPTVARLFDMARKLEGLYRHASTHAAGVVIGDRPLQELIPLYRDPRSDLPVSGFNMKFVEMAGLVKFDFLGLKTLTVLATAIDFIRQRGDEIDLDTIPLDDASTFEMIARGDTTGVFQLESSGMVEVLKGMRPDTFEDIIAVVALYRPGPMDNIPSYIDRKHGREEPDYLYPTLEGILKETFGIMIYQEQVMQIAQELSGYTLGGADLLRRAMGKKIQAEMDKQRQSFVDGAVAKGVPEAKASDIFRQVDKFAGYGFNKSHAAAYALVAYQTAYLKANYPVEFMAASMTLDMGNTDKLNVFHQELKKQEIALLPPDINKSGVVFSVERTGSNGTSKAGIRYALAAIKNVGGGAMESLVAEREANGPFKDINDLTERLDTQQINKRQLENLIRAGALDSVVPNRRQLTEVLETLLRHASLSQSERNSDQMGLFAGDATATPGITLPDIADWAPMDRLNEEFDAVGFYLSAHPLDAYAKTLKKLNVELSADIIARKQAAAVKLAGTVMKKTERTSAKGNRYAFIEFTDTSGTFEVTAFSEALAQYRDLLEPGEPLFIRATAQTDRDEVRFLLNSVEPLDTAAAGAADGMRVTVSDEAPLAPLNEILGRQGRGRGRVELLVRTAEDDVVLVLGEAYPVSSAVLKAVRGLPGILDVQEI